MKKKNLLIATDCFLPRWDGIARFLAELLPSISDRYKITVLAPDFEGKKTEFSGVNVVYLPLHFFKAGDFIPAKIPGKNIRQYVEEADIVFTQTIGSIGIKTVNMASKMRKPVIAYIHSIEWELVKKALWKYNIIRAVSDVIVKNIVRNTYNKCELLLIPSEGTGGLLSINGVRTRKEIVNLGVNIDKFYPAKDIRIAKKKIGIDPDRKVIGYCGRIGREKDLNTLLEAFKILNVRMRDTKLLIVGEGIKEITRQFEKEKDCILTGTQDNVVPYLQAMDIYVLPSLTETSSLSTMEAMSCGCPCVVTEVGYVKKYIKNKVNGMFFPKKNYSVLASKLQWLLEEDEIRRKIGKEARKTIERRYSWNRTVKKIIDVFDRY